MGVILVIGLCLLVSLVPDMLVKELLVSFVRTAFILSLDVVLISFSSMLYAGVFT